MTKLGKDFKLVTDRDGKVKIVSDEKAKMARLDLCTRLKKKNSKKQTWKASKG